MIRNRQISRSFVGIPAFVLGAFYASDRAYASGGGGFPQIINIYEIVVKDLMHLDPKWVVTLGSLVATGILIWVGTRFKAQVEKGHFGSLQSPAPSPRFSIASLVDFVMDLIYDMARDNCGKTFRMFIPLLATLFLFILINNLSGLIPGFPPATENMSQNLALGIVAFLVYNYAGLKEHGGSYVKQLMGPVAFIAPIFFCIEVVSHLSRPFSLGLRLMGNILGDHLLLWVFTGLTWIIFPAALLFFGLMVAVVQSFVFTLLTSIYIAMAVSHDH